MKILVVVDSDENSGNLIEWTHRFAAQNGCEWWCIHIETDTFEEKSQSLEADLALAHTMGAKVITFSGTDVVNDVLEYAGHHDFSLLVVGKGRKTPRRFRFRRKRQWRRFAEESSGIPVVILGKGGAASTRIRRGRGWGAPWSLIQCVTAASVLGAITFLNFLIVPISGHWSASILYLAAINFLSFSLDWLPLLLTAVVSGLLWDYLFIPPEFHFIPNRLDDVFMLFFFFFFALTSGRLTSRIRSDERKLRVREQRMRLLYELSEVLETANGVETASAAGMKFMGIAFRTTAMIYLKTEGSVLSDTSVEKLHTLAGSEKAAAVRCFSLGVPTGRFSSFPSDTEYRFVPLEALGGTIGVAGVRLDDVTVWSEEQEAFLMTLASTVSLAIQREIVNETNRKNFLAQESERLSRLLLHSVSHEMKTPLTVVRGCASALLDEETVGDRGARVQLVEEIISSTSRLDTIIGNLLSMNRLESGKLRLDIDLADPEEIVSLSLRQLRNELLGRPVDVRIPAAVPPVPCDILLVIQVLTNLLTNAVKYSAEGSPLEIRLDTDGSVVSFTVGDRGPGVSEEEVQFLFTKFFRGRNSKKDGLGLGLSICRGIIDAHGGSVAAWNRPGGGLSVRFTLRLAAEGMEKNS